MSCASCVSYEKSQPAEEEKRKESASCLVKRKKSRFVTRKKKMKTRRKLNFVFVVSFVCSEFLSRG